MTAAIDNRPQPTLLARGANSKPSESLPTAICECCAILVFKEVSRIPLNASIEALRVFITNNKTTPERLNAAVKMMKEQGLVIFRADAKDRTSITFGGTHSQFDTIFNRSNPSDPGTLPPAFQEYFKGQLLYSDALKVEIL